MPCDKRAPGSGCGARDGENRLHAIFGAGTRCVATHPSDLAVALLALDAALRLQAPEGERVVPIDDFFLCRATRRSAIRRSDRAS